MKVVLFCGGLGMRLREYSEAIPKPMVPIGYRPILWHVMKYYAHFGHKDFILCLGWNGNAIKEYFLGYNECLSNDFVMSSGGAKIDLLSSDIDDWNITFVDTGANTCVGQRLKAVQPLLAGEDVFLANYSDGLTDMHLPDLIESRAQQEAVAAFLAVPPTASFHAVTASDGCRVDRLESIDRSGVWMNGGFFVLTHEIFRYMQDGEELVIEPFERLIAEKRLSCMKYRGFWSCMDTYKEKHQLDEMYARGDTPWELWKRFPARGGATRGPRSQSRREAATGSFLGVVRKP